ncbi:GAF domain-containing sensor histidine kinase [Tellurirhabdus rosea]|uniref:GAF domain-containing sensor histidine kinase n=1 Tax=Tellurirhabdus rosea TaxID=2674997 RepID=UPI002257DD16|nr:GAF domain-containing sensor histidine kinase [Tellurirhabdus rosea]
MKTAPIPENEEVRLQALQDYAILDTLPEDDYDAITRLASVICDTPVSLISLVDRDRQWFKSAHGLEIRELPRDVAFCAHAILEPDHLFEIPDARQDDRFFDNPLTTGPLQVEFYAGAPLLDSAGNALGSLCVIDHYPRKLTTTQQQALRDLAHQVSQLLELRKRNHELAESQIRLQEAEQELQKALVLERKANELKSRFVSLVSHEFRTPLSIILSGIELIEMISQKVTDPALAQRLLENIEPIRVEILRLKHLINMAVQQENYQSNRMQFVLEPCDLVSFCQRLIERRRHQDPDYARLDFRPETDEAIIHADLMLLEHVLENLLSNGLKYSVDSLKPVEVRLWEADGRVHVSVKDYGIGIPEEDMERLGEGFFRASNTEGISGTGLGLALARQFTELQGGHLTIESQLGEYTLCQLSFPLLEN